jgi:PD-(D/E)XK nuclease superfamily
MLKAPLLDDAIEPTPSPLLPDTYVQYAWDSTSLSWAKTCPRLYYYNMICGYRPKEESIHQRFGREYQAALELFDRYRAEGMDHTAAQLRTVRYLLKALADYEDPHPDAKRSVMLKTRRNLVQAVIQHIEHYRDDPAQTVIMANKKPAVELSFRFQLDYGPITEQPYILCGHLDRVVTLGDGVFVMDHKTSAYTIGSSYFERYNQDNQMTLYTIAGQVVLRSPIKGVIIDAVQLLVGGPKFDRGFTFRTEDRLEEWMDDLSVHLRTFEQYAAQDYWPQNDTACDKFGGCRFREVCSRSPNVRHHFLDSDFTQEARWNPLKTR